MKEFHLTADFIELAKLLKLMRIAESGGHAKMLITGGFIKVNGIADHRKRAKLRSGDVVDIDGEKIRII